MGTEPGRALDKLVEEFLKSLEAPLSTYGYRLSMEARNLLILKFGEGVQRMRTLGEPTSTQVETARASVDSLGAEITRQAELVQEERRRASGQSILVRVIEPAMVTSALKRLCPPEGPGIWPFCG